MNPALDAALRCADLGLLVFPQWWPTADGCACGDRSCGSAGKHPLALDGFARHGRHDASADPAVVRGWFRRMPRANLAVATGPESGVWVLDLDGDDGRANLKTLIAQHGPLPRTPWAVSGSGGWHLYFRWPGGDRAPRSRPVPGWPGVDVRGKGSSATLPPSLHRSGRRYAWKPGHAPWEREPVDAPAWLLELVDPPRPAPKPVVRPINFDDDALSAYGWAALSRAEEEVAHAAPGSRNPTLNLAAYGIGRLVGAGAISYAAAAAALEQSAVWAGLPEREARLTVRSGLSSGAKHPRYPNLRRSA